MQVLRFHVIDLTQNNINYITKKKEGTLTTDSTYSTDPFFKRNMHYKQICKVSKALNQLLVILWTSRHIKHNRVAFGLFGVLIA